MAVRGRGAPGGLRRILLFGGARAGSRPGRWRRRRKDGIRGPGTPGVGQQQQPPAAARPDDAQRRNALRERCPCGRRRLDQPFDRERADVPLRACGLPARGAAPAGGDRIRHAELLLFRAGQRDRRRVGRAAQDLRMHRLGAAVAARDRDPLHHALRHPGADRDARRRAEQPAPDLGNRRGIDPRIHQGGGCRMAEIQPAQLPHRVRREQVFGLRPARPDPRGVRMPHDRPRNP